MYGLQLHNFFLSKLMASQALREIRYAIKHEGGGKKKAMKLGLLYFNVMLLRC